MDAGEGLQLADERVALPAGDKTAGLHRVHQQLEFGQLKGTLAQKPARSLPLAALHVQAEGAQRLHIIVDALALGMDIHALQCVDELLYGQGMLLVGALPEKLAQAEQFAFLVGASRHIHSSFLCLS